MTLDTAQIADIAHQPLFEALALASAAGLAALILTLLVRGRAIRKAPRPASTAIAPHGPATSLDAIIDECSVDAPPGADAALLLVHGRDAFAARALSARASGRSLDLMYYAWACDDCGRMLFAELLRAASRGVRVRLLVDDINATGIDDALLALDAHPQIEVRVHNPLWVRAGLGRALELLLRFARLNHRMHNKCWIADGRLAVLGGRNIGDRYFEAASEVNFRDLDMLVCGPSVARAAGIFDSYWNHASACPVSALAKASQRRLDAAVLGVEQAGDSQGAREFALQLARVSALGALLDGLPALRWTHGLEIASDPPGKWRFSKEREAWIATRLSGWFAQARRELLIVSPYFVPRRRFAAQLIRLARPGAVRVAVVTNSLAANDVAAVHGGYMRYRRRLLRAHVALYEVRPDPGADDERSVFGSSGASLHTKAVLIDARRGFVGSFNMDPRSARLNSEMGVFFEDEALAADLRAEIERLLAPTASYSVRLRGLRLQWLDASLDPPRLLDDEPRSTLAQRMIARLAGLLPIEQEL